MAKKSLSVSNTKIPKSFFLLIIILSSCGIGNKLPVEFSDSQQNTLVVISNVNCGYCKVAMEKMLPLSLCDNLDIIVVESSTGEELENVYKNYLYNYQFVKYDSLEFSKYYHKKCSDSHLKLTYT